jgi:hypothetical protein
LRLKRKDDFVVTATMDGYQPAEAEVHSRMRAGGGTATPYSAGSSGAWPTRATARSTIFVPIRYITMTPGGGAAPAAASQTTPAEAPAAAPAETAAAPSGAPQSE